MSHYQKFTPPFPIPDSWEWVRLEEIGTWQSGATPSKSQPKYYGEGYPWLNTGDLNDGVITNIPKQITEQALKETSVKLNPAGSVLIAMYGATIGKLGILSFSATTNQACCACIYPTINSKYLFFFLLAWRQQFISMGGGGAQPNISKEKIESTYLPVPPLSEQERIVGSIEKYFDLIDDLNIDCNDLNTTITLAKSKILELAMQGKLIPQDPSDESAAEMLRRVNPKARIITDNPHSRKLPNSWCEVRIIDLFHKMEREIPSGQKFKYIDIDSIDNKTNIANPKEVEVVKAPSRASRHTKKGDIVFSMVRPYLRNIAKVPFEGCIASTGFYVFSPTCAINKEFAFQLLLSPMVVNGLNTFIKGDNSPSINKDNVENYVVPLPPLNEQLRICERLGELYQILDEIETSLQS